MITTTFLTLLASSSPALTPAVPAADDSAWGRFRGPNGTGVAADDSPLPDAIGPEDNLSWKAAIPTGYSSPVLTDSHVFVTAVDGVTLLTFCFDRETGEEVWAQESPAPLEEPHRNVNSPAAATPATDGENVYVFFQRNGLMSYDSSGGLRWHVELDPFRNAYGMATSPILYGSTLLLQGDHDGDSYLLALDKDTGEELWRTDRPGTTHGFSTPVVYTPAEGPAEVVVSGSYQVAGYDVSSGEKLWWADGMAWQSKCTPVIHGDVAYVNSWMASPTELGAKALQVEWPEALETYDEDDDGKLTLAELSGMSLDRIWFLYDLDEDGGMNEEEWGYGVARGTAKNGLVAIQLGGRGDVTESHVAWRFRRSLPNVPSPIFYDELLYVLKEGGVFTSLDPASGGIVHDGRIEGATSTYYASPVAGDGKIITASQAGEIAVVQAGAQWEVLSVRELGEEIWATPAIAGGQVFVRSLEGLYCFAANATDGAPTEASSSQEEGGDTADGSQAGGDETWPWWRGPERDGIARDAAWTPEGAGEPLWTADVGLGYSSVSISNGRLYTLGFMEDQESDVVWCMDAETGEVIWAHAFAAAKWDKFHGGGTNTTPTIDGDMLYTLNREGKLHCFDALSGEVRWEQDLVDTYGVELPTWGFAASPVIVGDGMLINVGRLLMLGKASGEERYVTKDYGHAYSTPALFEHKGRERIALFNGFGLIVLDLADGAEYATYEWTTKYDVNAATPVVDGDEIFISSGYNKGAAMLKLGDGELEALWESRVMRTHMAGCVQIGEYLYGFDEAILKCIDKKGETLWAERGLGKGALTGAGDKLLINTSDGELIVAEATPEEFRPLSRKTVIDSGGVFWTMPVLLNGLIYCRSSNGQLVCLDHRADR